MDGTDSVTKVNNSQSAEFQERFLPYLAKKVP